MRSARDHLWILGLAGAALAISCAGGTDGRRPNPADLVAGEVADDAAGGDSPGDERVPDALPDAPDAPGDLPPDAPDAPADAADVPGDLPDPDASDARTDAPRDAASDPAGPPDADDVPPADLVVDPWSDVAAEDLAVASLAPSRGGASVGAQVTLAGTGFAPGLEVILGSLPVTVAVLGPHQALATFPPVDLHQVGPRDVTVRLGAQSVTLPAAFTYEFDEDPIVFVHGFMGSGQGDFGDMRDWFLAQGYPADHLWAIDYRDNKGENHAQARDELAPFVDNVLAVTGAERVDLVAHSMGGLSSRLFIRLYGGGTKVRDYVSTCGAHHGTSEGCLSPWWAGARDMCPAYGGADEPVQGELNGDPAVEDVDETPFGIEEGGAISWHAIYSKSDLVIVPWDSSCLDQEYRGDCTSPVNVGYTGLSHNDVPHTDYVIRQVSDFLRARNPNRP